MGVTVKMFCELIIKQGKRSLFITKNGKNSFMSISEALYEYRNEYVSEFRLIAAPGANSKGTVIELEYVVILCD